MNKKLFILPFLCFCFLVTLKGQAVKKGLVAYYSFSKGETLDMTGKNNNGTTIGLVSPVADRFGNDCSAMRFNGNGYIRVPSSQSLRSPDREISMSGWFKLEQGSLDNRTQLLWVTMVCKSDKPNEEDNSPQYRLQLTEKTVSLNTEFTEEKDQSWNLNQWYHVAMTYNGSVVKAYLDGQQYFSYPYFGSLASTGADLNIGRDVPGNLEFFTGTLDDIMIFNRALSDGEITSLYRDQSNKNLTYDPCSGNPILADSEPVTPPNTTTPTTNENRPRPPKKEVKKPKRSKEPKKDPAPEPLQDEPSTQPDPTLTPPPTGNVTDNVTDFEVEGPYEGITGQPMLWQGDTVYFQETVVVSSPNVSIYPYDHQREDGDIISLNVNGVWLLNKYTLKNKGKDPRKTNLTLLPNRENFLISKAWNLGDIAPNTLTVEIDDGSGRPRIVTINSEIGKSGAIKIVYQQ